MKKKMPKNWLGCPAKGSHLVESKFIVFKTPLNKDYDNKLAIQDRFCPSDLFQVDVSPGLWIDLTNTDRYYSPIEIEEQGCIYLKIKCNGQGSYPNKQQINKFISKCQEFLCDTPDGFIGVHCTHGFNRTGFMIVSYLVEILRFNVAYAIETFAHARPPGIYRQGYITELVRRYGRCLSLPWCPRLPSWVKYEKSYSNDNPSVSMASSCGKEHWKSYRNNGKRSKSKQVKQ